MDKMIYGLDLSNDVAIQNMEILTKELNITDDEINVCEKDNDNEKLKCYNLLQYERVI